MKKGNAIECSGVYAKWPKASRLNAVDAMHCDWMHCNTCSVVKCILSESSGFHVASLNAEDSMQRDLMQWSPCSEAHASRVNAVDFIQPGPKHPD